MPIYVTHIYAGDLKSVAIGGISTYIQELVKNSAGTGIEARLVGVTGDANDKIGKWGSRKLGNGRFTFLPLFYTPEQHLVYKAGIPLNVKFMFSLWFNRRMILSRFKKVRLLHVHRVELIMPFIFTREKIPIVLTIHGVGSKVDLAKAHILFNKRFLRNIYYSVESLAIKKADKVILVSMEGKEYYSNRYPTLKNKFMFIPTFVDTDLFRPIAKGALRVKYGFKPDEKILIFVGRFDFVKRLELLIESFRCLIRNDSNVRLLLIGDGAEKERLKTMVKELGVPAVDFFGVVEHGRLPEILNCADVFVLTSRWEGMPIVILEALACGLPVVATNVGQAYEVVKEGVTGYLIDKHEPDVIASKIALAIQNSQSMRAQCRDMAQKFYSSIVAEKIRDAYKEVIRQ